MNPTWEDPIPDEEEEESSYDRGFVYGRDAVIFLVDATQSMFDVQTEEAPFQLALRCAHMSLRNKIMVSNKDLVGIVLFGTEKTKNSRNETDFKHVYIFQDLSESGAEKVLETEDLMSLNAESFRQKYGHSTDFSIADALWICSIMFSNCKFSLSHRRILLFTANDHPHEHSLQLQIQAKTKAKDLYESSIYIELMHIQHFGQEFDPSKFYKDIALTEEDENCRFPDASAKFDELLTRVNCKHHNKRPLGSLNLTIGKDVKMAFKMYKLVVPTNKPSAVKLHKESNAELNMVSNMFLGDTGEILLPSDIKKFQEYGGKKIYLTDDEAKQIRHFDEAGLLLMGFKPKSYIKDHHHVRPSMFLYPDERSVQGSTRLCYAILLQCLKRDYVPICRIIARQNDAPKFVALLPQEQELDDRGNQTVPAGFHGIYLPFMEDIRSLKAEIKPKHNPSEALVEKSKEIIRKLQFAYSPENIENPVLQKHWRNIEALALNKEAPEELVDYTLPTKDVIEKRVGKLIEEYRHLLSAGNTDVTATQMYGSAAKRARVEETAVPIDLQTEAANGLLVRFKVNVLKEFCKRNGIRCGQKKAEIIDAINRYYGM